jgi:hypothetical protein
MARYDDTSLLNAALWWTRCGSHTQYTAITSATTITTPAGAVKAMLQNTSTVNLRYRTDGGDPTVTVGFSLPAGAAPTVVPVNIGDTLIVIGASGAILDVQWGQVS